MGGCLSSTEAEASRSTESNHYRRNSNSSTANVISANGDLHQYTTPLTVSQVLEMEFQTTPNPTPTPTPTTSNLFFVCHSDRLYYDDYIPALDAQHRLLPNQIYFVLPVSKLQYRLTASDMAALAVKATLALQKSSTTTNSKKKHSSSSFYIRNRGNNKSARISPILVDHVNSTSSTNSSSSSSVGDGDFVEDNRNGQTVTTIKKGISVVSNKQQPSAAAASESGSVRKLQRYSSRRAKMAVRSFRIRLTTIHEEASVLQFY